jgi:uncharacterized protein (DUF2062 family)
VVFKRRVKRSYRESFLEFFWPRGGWGRAFEYVKHRVRRLPDTPEKIARGVWAGVFVSFTPFFGLHFLIAFLIAKAMRGNILAALLATFFGNPLTFLPIGVVSINTGYFLLGSRPAESTARRLPQLFSGAWADLGHNFGALFGPESMDWSRLHRFYDTVFLPYLVGGILPGIIAATVCYYLSLKLIEAYQNHRRKKLSEKLAQLRKTPAPTADVPPGPR